MPIRKELHREEFTSKGGSYICLGHYKNKDHNFEDYNKSTFIYDASGVYQQKPTFAKGLATGKFGPGFVRRQQKDCKNPRKEEIERDKIAIQERAQRTGAIRQKNLEAVDAKNGFNIITGDIRGHGPKEKKEGMRRIETKISDEIAFRGKCTLRDTGGRFFLPHGSGLQHDYRQDNLYREGLVKPKYTSVIQLGKKDIRSYGIEDCFSKAEYQNTNEITRTGLHEHRMPGKFTPRKVPGNPSGNPAIVRDWAGTADLSNSAMRNSSSSMSNLIS